MLRVLRTLCVALLLGATPAAAADRSFILNQPFAQVLAKLRSPSTTFPAEIEFAELTLSDSPDRLHFTGPARISGHRIQLAGSYQQGPHYAILHAYSRRPAGQISFLNAWAMVHAYTLTSTRIQLHLDVRPCVPQYFGPLGRPRRLINALIRARAAAIAATLVHSALFRAESQLRAALQ